MIRHSVICAHCVAQRARPVADERGYGSSACPGCPRSGDPDDPHPCVVRFGWRPDFPETAPRARRVWTATACGWGASAEEERAAWWAAFDHQGVLDVWRGRPEIERPRPDAGPRDRRRMSYEIEAARLPGVPLRTLMACVDDSSGRSHHPCRGVIPAGPGPAELCACPCHDGPHEEPDPCRHYGALVGHRGSCPTGGRPAQTTHAGANAQLTLFQ